MQQTFYLLFGKTFVKRLILIGLLASDPTIYSYFNFL